MLKSVASGVKDVLSIRCVHPISGEEVTPTAVQLSVYQNGVTPTSIQAAAATFSGSELTYVTVWGLTLGPYRAVWEVTTAVDTFTLEQYFTVTKHRWRTPLGATDFVNKYPYLEARVPTNSTVMDFIHAAWDEIGGILYGKLGHHPSTMLYPEQLALAVEMLAVSNLYRAISMQPNDSEFIKAESYRQFAVDALSASLTLVVQDSTDTYTPDSTGSNNNSPEFTRLRTTAQRRQDI